MPEKITAVVLNWNSADDTRRCVAAVRAGTVVPDVIVVDNGSTEPFESADIALDTNLGYAGGMNAGIRAAHANGAEWVWLLNADCVPRPDALEHLLPFLGKFQAMTSLQVTSATPEADDPRPYVVAAHLPNGRVRPVLCDGSCADGVHEVDVVTGAAILLDVRAALDAGLFDERFFHYKEEFDLVRRMAVAGGAVGFVCSSTVWHHLGGSLDTASPRARYYHHRNEVLYVRKHYRRPVLRLLMEPVHYKVLATAVLGALTGTGSRAVLAGYWDGVRGVHGRTERF